MSEFNKQFNTSTTSYTSSIRTDLKEEQLTQMLTHQLPAEGELLGLAILPFCHPAILLSCHSAILPFCYPDILPSCLVTLLWCYYDVITPHGTWACSVRLLFNFSDFSLDNSWLLSWVRSLPQRSPSTLSLILHSASLGTTPLLAPELHL